MSNDINLLPKELERQSVRSVVQNSNLVLRDVYSDLFGGSNSIIDCRGSNFYLVNNGNDGRYYKFYQRMGEVLGNSDEFERQVRNIIRDEGRGYRRLLES